MRCFVQAVPNCSGRGDFYYDFCSCIEDIFNMLLCGTQIFVFS